ncbi:MAG: hypothetical protein U0Y10_09760 [Spirosomataceae bacterium]
MTNASFLSYLFAHETLYRVESEAVTPATVDLAPTPPQVVTPVVEVPQSPVNQAPTPPSSTYQSMGYSQKVLILISEPKHSVLSESDADFLEKVLKAVNLTSAEVDFINIDKVDKQADFKDMLSAKQVHHFLTFGVPLKRLKLEILLVPYQIKQVEGINFLYADPLATIQQDVAKKKALWVCLKKLFGMA